MVSRFEEVVVEIFGFQFFDFFRFFLEGFCGGRGLRISIGIFLKIIGEGFYGSCCEGGGCGYILEECYDIIKHEFSSNFCSFGCGNWWRCCAETICQ